jgi:hypothetical protein
MPEKDCGYAALVNSPTQSSLQTNQHAMIGNVINSMGICDINIKGDQDPET